MSDKRQTPSDPAKNSPDRPDEPPKVIDYVLTAPSLEAVPLERDRAVTRESEHCEEEEGLGSAIHRRFAPFGGVILPEFPDQPMREPPDFCGSEYDWPDDVDALSIIHSRFGKEPE